MTQHWLVSQTTFFLSNSLVNSTKMYIRPVAVGQCKMTQTCLFYNIYRSQN